MTIQLALVTAHFVSDFMLQSGFRERRGALSLIRHICVADGVKL